MERTKKLTTKKSFVILLLIFLIIIISCTTTSSKSTTKTFFDGDFGYLLINDGKEVCIESYNAVPLPPAEISKVKFGNTNWIFSAGYFFTLQLNDNGMATVNMKENNIGTWEKKDNNLIINMVSKDGNDIISTLDIINDSTMTGNYYYEKGSFYITFFKKTPQPEKNIIIPENINNLPVTKIDGKISFQYQNITSLTLPNTITHIANNSFNNNNITSIVIPDSVVYLSGFNNNKINEISIPPSVKTIGNSAFLGNLITTVTIPRTVTEIGASAFYTNKITTLTIPETITEIGAYAFGSNPLSTVNIPVSLWNNGKIGSLAFGNKTTTKIIFSSGEYINALAFDNALTMRTKIKNLNDQIEKDDSFLRVIFPIELNRTTGIELGLGRQAARDHLENLKNQVEQAEKRLEKNQKEFEMLTNSYNELISKELKKQ